MGYNTVAVLLNDQTHEIEKSGRLGERIASAIKSYSWARGRDRSALYFGSGAVISQSHADDYQAVIVHGNTGWRLDDPDIPEAAINMVLWHLKERGYRVSKTKARQGDKS